jgi:hypothetical protein
MRITVRQLKSIITEALAAPKGYAARKPAPKRSAAPKKPAPALTITVEVDKGSK